MKSVILLAIITLLGGILSAGIHSTGCSNFKDRRRAAANDYARAISGKVEQCAHPGWSAEHSICVIAVNSTCRDLVIIEGNSNQKISAKQIYTWCIDTGGENR